ncbi:TPA: methylase, partial [Streptococcus agalactiae]|nr:methylase [Streptococcus agalactiae]
MEENLIKSKHRVQKHGEVFTPSWMVQKMLDTPGIKEACENVSATFLEPSAGDGNFLQAILERKLASVIKQYGK